MPCFHHYAMDLEYPLRYLHNGTLLCSYGSASLLPENKKRYIDVHSILSSLKSQVLKLPATRLTMTTPNVIVFGETGAGKSSVINLIAGFDIAPISNRPVGCTFQSTRYTVDIGGVLFNLHDTAGLDEAKGGTVAKHDAIVQLYTLLRRLNTGVSLLVFCMRGPRIKESCVKNWRLFHEIICQRKVPIVLAVTGLENEENGMDYWWTQNKEYFMRYEMYPNGVACITATRGKKMSRDGYRFDEEYAESQFKMREAIRTVYLRTPWQVPTAEWFKEIIEVSYTPGKDPEEIRQSRLVLGSATEELVKRCEMTGEEAKDLARKLNTFQYFNHYDL